MDRFMIGTGKVQAEVSDYGATLLKLLVEDANGIRRDVVLGYDTIEEYQKGGCFFGASIGRFAGYIAKGQVACGGRMLQLDITDEKNHLHGGFCGFDKRVWDVAAQDEQAITFRRTSPDGEEKYPGNLEVSITYRVTEDALCICYEALCDADTVLNLTNHSYFNLNGEGSGDVLRHTLQILADEVNEDDADGISAPAAFVVDGTPFDFRTPKEIGRDIGADDVQLRYASGYDHNFYLGHADAPRKVVCVRGDESGLSMEISTNMPGVQLYTANFLESEHGKGGHVYEKHHALCLETQYCASGAEIADGRFYPVQKAGEPYRQETTFRFIG